MGLFLAPCEGSVFSLRLEMSEAGFLRSPQNGMCVNVQGAPGTKTGAAVNLAACEDVHVETSGLWKMMEGGFIRNVGNDWRDQHKCMEIYSAPGENQKAADGAPINLDVCEINTDQTWELAPDGLLRSGLGARKCIDVRRVPGMTSSMLWLKPCEEWLDPTQFLHVKWLLTSNGELQNRRSQRCIGLKGNFGQGPELPKTPWRGLIHGKPPEETVDMEVRPIIELLPCLGEGGGGHRQWDLRPDGSVVNRLAGECLGNNGKVGEPLEVRPCVQGAAQKWSLTPEGFLRQGGACVVQRPDTEQLAVESCPSSMQRWDFTDRGLLRNRLTSECIGMDSELREPSAFGVPSGLSTQPCDDQRSELLWERVSL